MGVDSEVSRSLSISTGDLPDLPAVWSFVMKHVDEFGPVHGIKVQRYTSVGGFGEPTEEGGSHYSVAIWGDPPSGPWLDPA